MKVLLTGITGNLGFEIARSLQNRGAIVVPIVRNEKQLRSSDLQVESIVQSDLIQDEITINFDDIDCIVHSAGNVHFEKVGNENSKMMLSVIKIAKELGVPVYYVSTAFLWRPNDNNDGYRNAYEKDKAHSEVILKDSGVRHTIFRPSVLVGHSQTGALRNWSGYYLLVRKFLGAAILAKANKRIIKFPILNGTSNMVPIDQASEVIVDRVLKKELGKFIYITNPEPPKADWVLNITLDFFGIKNCFDFVEEEHKPSKKAKNRVISEIGHHFSPYWSLSYNFPDSTCKQNLITKEYLEKTLSLFQEINKN